MITNLYHPAAKRAALDTLKLGRDIVSLSSSPRTCTFQTLYIYLTSGFRRCVPSKRRIEDSSGAPPPTTPLISGERVQLAHGP